MWYGPRKTSPKIQSGPAGGECPAHEPADALRFAVLVHLEDVLFGRELERDAGDDEFDVGHVGNGVAVDGGGAADARNQVADALNLADDDFSVTFWAIMLCA